MASADMNNPHFQDEEDIVILGLHNLSPEDRKAFCEMVRPVVEKMEQEWKEEKRRKRRANYKPRGPWKKQIDPVTFTCECIAQAEISVTETGVRLARSLYDISDEKEFVVGTLRCAREPDLQDDLLEYLNSHDNPSTQDIALYVYGAMSGREDRGG